MSHSSFVPGSLFIAGFVQARAPHAGLLIPTNETSGRLFHIRIDRSKSDLWEYQSRSQRIAGDMFCSTLLCLRVATNPSDAISADRVEGIAKSVPVPCNDEFGECSPWVLATVQALKEHGLLEVEDVAAPGKEFEDFAAGNNAYARRDKFPNVKQSALCK